MGAAGLTAVPDMQPALEDGPCFVPPCNQGCRDMFHHPWPVMESPSPSTFLGMAAGASRPRVGVEDRAPGQHRRLGGGASSPMDTHGRWTVRRQFGVRMKGLMAVLIAAASLTLFPSAALH